MKVEEIYEKVNKYAFQSAVVDVSDIIFSPNVVAACEKNYCGKYNTCWTCPPALGDLDSLKKKYEKYKKALVFTTKSLLEDSFDFEGMMTARAEHDKTQNVIVDSLGLEDCTLLGAGGCTICEKCTYPDAPCRFPEKVITSVEANGINVVELAKTANINYYNGENTVTYFSVYFLGEAYEAR